MKEIKIVIATIFQNAGDATRAIEIAKFIRQFAPEGVIPHITFISRGGKFEKLAKKLGFDIYDASPRFLGHRYQDDFKTGFGELIGDPKLAKDILLSEIEAYKKLKPDFLLYGFWPLASIARRMAIPEVPHSAFLPLPLIESFVECIKTFPDEMSVSILPASLQKRILKIMPQKIKLHLQALRHSCIRDAALDLGWKGENLSNIFSMLRSDFYLINDFPEFYNTVNFNKNVSFTGPVFSVTENSEITGDKILSILNKNNKRTKIFCTLGSSGNKKALKEIINAFNTNAGMEWSGILLSPPGICPIEEAIDCSKNRNLYITDKFIPAVEINKHVDLVICHGGQGTLQTAIASATPLIGIATQPEQKINLEHLQDFGSAIRIPLRKWNSKKIVRSVNTIRQNGIYKEKAMELCERSKTIETGRIIAESIWEKIII